MRTSLRLASLFTVACLAAAGCTQRVYLIRGEDGVYREVDPEAVEVTRRTVLEVPEIVEDGLSVSLAPSQDYVLAQGPDGQLYLMLTLEADRIEVERQGPVNLALVIDRSGSMQGSKLEDVKRAAAYLLTRLRDGDRVALLSYASDVSVEMPSTVLNSATRGRMLHAIEDLYPAGGTYLSGGLEAGMAEVRRFLDAEGLNRIILLSDGRANVGVTDPESLTVAADRGREQGMSLTTMGVGLDYQEEVMEALALAGGGNYYFIEQMSDLESVLGRELELLAGTVVDDAILELELPPGVDLDDVFGYRYERKGRTVRVKLNSLSAGQKRRVLLALDLPRGIQGSQLVARAELAYRDARRRTARRLSLPDVRVVATADRELVTRSIRRPVLEKVEAVKNAVAKRDAMRRFESGDSSGAQQVLERRAAEGRRVYEFSGSEVVEGELKRLERVQREVQAAPAPSTDASKRMLKSNRKAASDSLAY
jgi:Ca-activated chloride channel family protein